MTTHRRSQALRPPAGPLAGLVASFRASIGPDVDDPGIAQLVGELSLASEPFRRLWARHDVKALAGAAIRVHHPEVGPLTLGSEKLPVGDSGGQVLVIYQAEPGSATAWALGRARKRAEADGPSPAHRTAAPRSSGATAAYAVMSRLPGWTAGRGSRV